MKRALVAAGLLLGLALLASPAQAQTGSMRGRVLDVDGKPAPEVKVTIEFLGGITRKFETKSNKKGEFMQVGLQPGMYRITAVKEGTQPATRELRVSLGDPTEIGELKLQPPAKAAGPSASELLRKAFSTAVEAQNAGKLDEAEAAYKKIIEVNPDIPEVHHNLGMIYMQRKDYPAAEAALQKALELRPDYSEATASLASLYQATGQGDKALALMEKAAGNPADAKAQFGRGIVLMKAGKPEEAAQAFDAATKADPNMADAWYWMGSQLLNLGKTAEAVAAYEKYVALKPGNAQQEKIAADMIAALKKK